MLNAIIKFTLHWALPAGRQGINFNRIGMYSFLLQIAFMASLGLIIYLFARAVPRIGDELPDNKPGSRFDQLISSFPIEKFDASIGAFMEKTLRKLRLIILRLDNAIGGYLNNIKKLSGNGFRNGQEKPSIFTGNGNGDNHSENNKS